MLLTEFFNNPMGKGSAVLNIKTIKENFDKKYDKIYKDINHKTFFIKKNIYISINIPSSVKGIFYDVVIKFIPNKNSTGISVTDMDYQFFSNSPSFLYTYANAYAKKKLLIRELDKKLSKEMIKQIATTRNPYSVISYDYTIYCALKYILINGYDKISALKINCIESSNTSQLLKSIQNWEVLQKNRSMQKNLNKIEELENIEDKKNKIKNADKTIKKVKNTKSKIKTQKVSKVKKVIKK